MRGRVPEEDGDDNKNQETSCRDKKLLRLREPFQVLFPAELPIVEFGFAVSEFLLEPSVELVSIGLDPGLRRAVEPVDGQAHLGLPSLAGPDVAPEMGADFLPGFEDSPVLHMPSRAPIVWPGFYRRKMGLSTIGWPERGTFRSVHRLSKRGMGERF